MLWHTIFGSQPPQDTIPCHHPSSPVLRRSFEFHAIALLLLSLSGCSPKPMMITVINSHFNAPIEGAFVKAMPSGHYFKIFSFFHHGDEGFTDQNGSVFLNVSPLKNIHIQVHASGHRIHQIRIPHPEKSKKPIEAPAFSILGGISESSILIRIQSLKNDFQSHSPVNLATMSKEQQ